MVPNRIVPSPTVECKVSGTGLVLPESYYKPYSEGEESVDQGMCLDTGRRRVVHLYLFFAEKCPTVEIIQPVAGVISEAPCKQMPFDDN